MSARKNRTAPKVFVDGPAVLHPGHVQDRVISPAAGAPKAWRNLSPLESAHAKNQLSGGNQRYSAAQRFEAGTNYAQIFLIANGAGGRDSTQAMNVAGGTAGYEMPQSQQMAFRALAEIDGCMGARDARIIRKVCGEGHKPVDAIKEICADYQHTVAARFREALDALIEAFQQGRASHREAS